MGGGLVKQMLVAAVQGERHRDQADDEPPMGPVAQPRDLGASYKQAESDIAQEAALLATRARPGNPPGRDEDEREGAEGDEYPQRVDDQEDRADERGRRVVRPAAEPGADVEKVVQSGQTGTGAPARTRATTWGPPGRAAAATWGSPDWAGTITCGSVAIASYMRAPTNVLTAGTLPCA
jgi:hypothetical protein